MRTSLLPRCERDIRLKCAHRQLFSLQYGESVGVADWFQSFCAVFHTRAGVDEAEASTPGNKTGRRRGKKQSQSSSSSQVCPHTRPFVLEAAGSVGDVVCQPSNK